MLLFDDELLLCFGFPGVLPDHDFLGNCLAVSDGRGDDDGGGHVGGGDGVGVVDGAEQCALERDKADLRGLFHAADHDLLRFGREGQPGFFLLSRICGNAFYGRDFGVTEIEVGGRVGNCLFLFVVGIRHSGVVERQFAAVFELYGLHVGASGAFGKVQPGGAVRHGGGGGKNRQT